MLEFPAESQLSAGCLVVDLLACYIWWFVFSHFHLYRNFRKNICQGKRRFGESTTKHNYLKIVGTCLVPTCSLLEYMELRYFIYLPWNVPYCYCPYVLCRGGSGYLRTNSNVGARATQRYGSLSWIAPSTSQSLPSTPTVQSEKGLSFY